MTKLRKRAMANTNLADAKTLIAGVAKDPPCWTTIDVTPGMAFKAGVNGTSLAIAKRIFLRRLHQSEMLQHMIDALDELSQTVVEDHLKGPSHPITKIKSIRKILQELVDEMKSKPSMILRIHPLFGPLKVEVDKLVNYGLARIQSIPEGDSLMKYYRLGEKLGAIRVGGDHPTVGHYRRNTKRIADEFDEDELCDAPVLARLIQLIGEESSPDLGASIERCVRTDGGELHVCIESGISFSAEYLIRVIEDELIMRPVSAAEPDETALAYGYLGLQFDDQRLIVKRAGYDATVDFSRSPLQWELLKFLSQSEDRCAFRVALARVWKSIGVASDPEEGTMTNAVSELRRKIEVLGITIKSIWKRGWKLTELKEGVAASWKKKPSRPPSKTSKRGRRS
jgi:hypothetical protein